MANSPAPTSTTSTRRGNLLKIIAIVLLSLTVIVGLIVLIGWLVIKPKKLVYTIHDSSVHGFNLSHDHLKANFYFMVEAHNPNRRVAFYYDSIEVTVSYDVQKIAFYSVQPFFQPHKNVTKLEVRPVANSVSLMNSVSRDLKLEKSSGEVELKVFMKARIRYKVGLWKSRHRTVKIKCLPVFIHLSSSKHFKTVNCDVDT